MPLGQQPCEIASSICDHIEHPNDLRSLSQTCRYFRSVTRARVWAEFTFTFLSNGDIMPRDHEKAEFVLENKQYFGCVEKIIVDASRLSYKVVPGEEHVPIPTSPSGKKWIHLWGLPKVIKEALKWRPIKAVVYRGPTKDPRSAGAPRPTDFLPVDLVPFLLRRNMDEVNARVGFWRKVSKMEAQLLHILSMSSHLRSLDLKDLEFDPDDYQRFLFLPPTEDEEGFKLDAMDAPGADDDDGLMPYQRPANIILHPIFTAVRSLSLSDCNSAVLHEIKTVGGLRLEDLSLRYADMTCVKMFAVLNSMDLKGVTRFAVWLQAYASGEQQDDMIAKLAKLMPKLRIFTIEVANFTGLSNLPHIPPTFGVPPLTTLHLVQPIDNPDFFRHHRFHTRKDFGHYLFWAAVSCPALVVIRFFSNFNVGNATGPTRGWWKVYREDGPEARIETNGKVVIVSDEDEDRRKVEEWRKNVDEGESGLKLFEIRGTSSELRRYLKEKKEDLDENETKAMKGWTV